MKLFPRIFLSFWLATVLMIVAVITISEILEFTTPHDRKAGFEPDAAQSELTEAVNTYERLGQQALIAQVQGLAGMRHRRLFIFDPSGKVLIGDGSSPPPFYRELAYDAQHSGHAIMRRYFVSRMLFVCPVRSDTGREYVAVLIAFGPRTRLLKLHFWFNVMIAMVPAALVCMALTLYLTRPITKLRTTAQRLAAGDLSARSSTHRIARRDELGDLARDFDTMAAQIERLMTAQRRFVADVSHELGGPLTRMHLALSLLRRQFPGQGSAEMGRLERETDKLSNLVQQLLLLAGMEAGRRPAESLAPVSLRVLCGSIVDDANFEAAQAGCHIGGSRDDETLLAYPQLLRRAIDNVLRNAIRYSPAGSEILLNCTVDHDRQLVTMEVLDSGPGVPETMLADIFKPFFRTAPGRETESGGTGLGLAIAAEAVHMHDGTIAAQNRKEGGLCVTITLPLRAPTDEFAIQQPTADSST
ncbi:MAG TPA: ATP-binding protein [Terracidiphilus sp.]|nr:ATP-binding protein [Terracidiphilus sp.]